jgi:glycosyltransferase involved in cell wall biosynthesis
MDQTVSVIINVFNGGRYIEEALVSALNQTYRKCEVLVFDNCSNDDTAEICNKYNNKIAYYKNSKTVP